MRLAIALIVLAAASLPAAAQDFRIEEVPSAAAQPLAQLKPKTVAFSDHRKGEFVDPVSGLMKFADWSRTQPLQREFLGLYTGYGEPTITTQENGAAKTRKIRLHVYVAEARFMVARPPASIDLARYATVPFLERMDPAIKSRVIAPAEVIPLKDAALAYNRNPERPWCEGKAVTICLQSRYKLEGKLPIGIMLLNKLRDSEKKVADFIEFQSDMRVLGPADLDEAKIKTLTGLDTPVVGALEQNIFWVNQIMQFGKFLAVLEQYPGEPDKSIVTAFVALGVDSDLLEKKKEYENVPVLRNLVPSQVLSGNSSFNTGNSISAGLPAYARNRIKAIAEILEKDRGGTAAAK